jgi:nucleoside-diphosphate-sugar epimerase
VERMRVLVLGSHGCVGKAVVRFFETKGHTVISWDIKLGDEYDLRKPGILDPILPSVDFVIFLAFDVGGSKYKINSVEYIENNLNILKHTFRSLQEAKKPFLHSSSMMSNMNNNPYAVLKRLGEFYTEIVGGVNVKLWNVYGSEPITEKSHVIPDFLIQAISSDKIQMRTSGTEERLFLYCDDFAAALHVLMEHYDEFVGKEPVDISCKEWVSVKQMAYVIKELSKEILDKEIEVLEGGYVDTFHNRKNEPTDSVLNTRWAPTVSLKEGIRAVFLSMV